MCVTGNQFNSLRFVHFIGIFLRWYLFTFILFPEKKPHSTIMLEPKQFINHHNGICFVFSCRMAEATTSRHESNYIKIAMVVLRVSPRAVRVQFDNKFDPKCLKTTLNSKWDCLTGLKTKKRITQPQWELLFPKTGRLFYLFCLN